MQPPGDQPDAVAPYLSELLVAYDRLVHELALDPTIGHEDDHPVVTELVELFRDDSDVPTVLLDAWASNSYGRPPEDDRPALVSVLDDVEAVSENEVGFTACARQRIYTYDEDADLVRGVGYTNGIFIEGTAIRVSGSWVLDEFGVTEGAACGEGVVP